MFVLIPVSAAPERLPGYPLLQGKLHFKVDPKDKENSKIKVRTAVLSLA